MSFSQRESVNPISSSSFHYNTAAFPPTRGISLYSSSGNFVLYFTDDQPDISSPTVGVPTYLYKGQFYPYSIVKMTTTHGTPLAIGKVLLY